MATVKDFEPLYLAIESFIRSNSNFESSVVINAALEEIEQCASLQLTFSIPIQHKLLTLESVLKWVLFLTVIPSALLVDEEDEEYKTKLSEFNQFSANEALKLVAEVYDMGVQDIILCHIEDDEESEDGSDEGSEEDSDGEPKDSEFVE